MVLETGLTTPRMRREPHKQTVIVQFLHAHPCSPPGPGSYRQLLVSIAPLRSMSPFSRASIFLLYHRYWRSRSRHLPPRILRRSPRSPSKNRRIPPSSCKGNVAQKTRLQLSITQRSSSGHVEFRIKRPTRSHSRMSGIPPKLEVREAPCEVRFALPRGATDGPGRPPARQRSPTEVVRWSDHTTVRS